MKRFLLPFLLLSAFVALVVPMNQYLKTRPVAVKLGYVPSAGALRMISGEYKVAVAEMNVLKVLFYFGSIMDQAYEGQFNPPEYYSMYKMLESAVLLDPYNMDAYYFANAAFTWEVGRAKDVNAMLDYGMKYRDWDWYLPFFAGFNEAYFLKNYPKAATYMQKAAELSGSTLYTNLAARFFFEAGETDFGILFLDAMIAEAKDPAMQQTYQLRRDALVATRALEQAVERYSVLYSRLPEQLVDLVTSGLLDELPVDPYGGTFYLDESGKVRSTSKFAFAPVHSN